MRTARDRTSGENLFVAGLLITPPSQGLEPPANPARFMVSKRDRAFGLFYVLDTESRSGLTDNQLASLDEVVDLIVWEREIAWEQTRLALVSDRALRADRILHLVSEAMSCTEALTSLLGELCLHHGAVVGRIWELVDGKMSEISRFNGERLASDSYYRRPTAGTITAANSTTARAIESNRADTVIYSQVHNVEDFAMMANAIASGLASQVSFPIWLDTKRFGISMIFDTERSDLAAIVDDIALLANTIRPALFRKVSEERIIHFAQHDSLTQLVNRVVMHQRLQVALEGAARGEHSLALLYLDLDGFKGINDAHGHEVGDHLLTAVASRLLETVREGDTVALIGGDEFAIVQPLGGQPHAGTALAQRILEMVSGPFDISGKHIVIGISIGIAVYPVDGTSSETLLQNADLALYQAKGMGRNTYRLFEPSMRLQQQKRLIIERDLKDAVDHQEFQLAYQPICHSQTLRVAGFEALLRWSHANHGTVRPDEFVPLAEANGKILPLGRWAMEAACAHAARWSEPVMLSVNLSPLQFRQVDLADQISSALLRSGLAPNRLGVEVTEGILLDDSALVLRTMAALKDLGVRITLDDFGTAYASLSYLRRFPFDALKIDKSFVQGMRDDDSTLAIVQAILALSKRLDIAVIAEGVEAEWQLEMLREFGCSLVQGFWTGRPMAYEQTEAAISGSFRDPQVQ